MIGHAEAAALGYLRAALGNDQAAFRPGQWEAIAALVTRRERLLVVERTGWGKSSVYFIATRLLREQGMGPTLIISPLLALMRNQVDAADRFKVRALTINSTNPAEWPTLHQAIRDNEADALLVSPERLASDRFVSEVLMPMAGGVGLVVVDEAHCISDWGHDFRPDYRRLVNVLRRIPPNVPILGTTATANDRVVADVQAQLGNMGLQRGPLMRETLALQTIRLPGQAARLAWLAEHIPQMPGTGIVYVLTKRDAEQVSAWLNRNGVSASPYYSGVTSEKHPDSNACRLHLEEALFSNRIKVLVATTALSMGYDKPDLGFVVHYQSPGSIVGYYQQVGRAGRAIDHAIGVLMSGAEDAQIQTFFRESAFPREPWVQAILAALEESDGLTVRQIEAALNLRQGKINQVLKLLSVESPAPVIQDGSTWRRTPVPYRMDHERIERLTRQREIEWDEIQTYIDEAGCLMQFLARALDDADPQPCGRCANCLGRDIVPSAFSDALGVAATRFLRQAERPLPPRKQVPAGAFSQYPLRGIIPDRLRAETGRILSQWGDAGWGKAVADDKHAGFFRDELVEAAADMIVTRWKPVPRPEWVTCIPSTSHPDLVPDFAQRLADRLGIPFLPVIGKVRANAPQKDQENSTQQCRNLDGVFALAGDAAVGRPVLLVDDVVDSGWTLTVAAALLRGCGSGPVFPMALTASGAGD